MKDSKEPAYLVKCHIDKITGISIDEAGRKYSANLSIEFFDHFGLDSLDIDPNEKPEFAYLGGFLSWFVLQHSKKFCEQPFITLMKFNEVINGTY